MTASVYFIKVSPPLAPSASASGKNSVSYYCVMNTGKYSNYLYDTGQSVPEFSLMGCIITHFCIIVAMLKTSVFTGRESFHDTRSALCLTGRFPPQTVTAAFSADTAETSESGPGTRRQIVPGAYTFPIRLRVYGKSVRRRACSYPRPRSLDGGDGYAIMTLLYYVS